jgi:glucans biosynthesis protein C
MAASPLPAARYHSLDALRATLMTLGLVLHTAINYTVTPIGVWPYKDPSTNIGFDLLFFFIHLFRMPAFFVTAGFFAALLYQRRGRSSMLRNRIRRVLLPLLMAYMTIIPFVILGFGFTIKGGGAAGWQEATHMLVTLSFWEYMSLAHLWFLYFLLVYYGLALLLLPLVRNLWKSLPARWQALATIQVSRHRALPVFSLLTMLTLLPMKEPVLDAYTSWIPDPEILVAYAVFFGYGWLLYRQRENLEFFKAHWKAYLGAGLGVCVVFSLFLLPNPLSQSLTGSLLAKGLSALSVWLLIFASLGLFIRFFKDPHPIIRYLSDASYWIYLVHLPVVVVMVGVMASLPLSAGVKFSGVLVITLLVTLSSYHYLVRSTAVGVLLNGRRYPKALPPLKAEEAEKPVLT